MSNEGTVSVLQYIIALAEHHHKANANFVPVSVLKASLDALTPPKPKQYAWERTVDLDTCTDSFYCGRCKHSSKLIYPFCPWCGAEMIKPNQATLYIGKGEKGE